MDALAAAALALVVNAHCGFPSLVAHEAASIVMRENAGMDAAAVKRNTNGTFDHGLTQVNTVNYGWLSIAMRRPINDQTIMDVCTNLEAGLRVEWVRYNGNPPPTIAAAYSTRALQAAIAVDDVVAPPQPAPPPLPPPCAPAWDAWALAACSKNSRAPVTPPPTKEEPPRAN